MQIILNSRMMDSDLLEQLRRIWSGGYVEPCGPRAAGRVATWALQRASSVIARSGTGSFRTAQQGAAEPTPHERSVLAILDALCSQDHALAANHARWLVHRHAVEQLLRALEPIASGPARLTRAA